MPACRQQQVSQKFGRLILKIKKTKTTIFKTTRINLTVSRGVVLQPAASAASQCFPVLSLSLNCPRTPPFSPPKERADCRPGLGAEPVAQNPVHARKLWGTRLQLELHPSPYISSPRTCLVLPTQLFSRFSPKHAGLSDTASPQKIFFFFS